MDDTDYKILNILQENAKTSIKQISELVHLTPPAVAERIKRLENNDIILGYHARIDHTKLSKSIFAIIGVDVKPELNSKFNHYCKNEPNIIACMRVIGNVNSILHVTVANTTDLKAVIDQLKTYGPTNTNIVLSSIFNFKDITT